MYSQQDRQYVGKTLNAMTSAMFQAFISANIPRDVLDGIVAGDKRPMEGYAAHLMSSDMPHEERTLRVNLIAWAINTVQVAKLLGMELIKDENLQGDAPKLQKPKGFG